ncbi:biotin/lipoyl attachment domain-containing protein [Ignisphaera aggregans DSM 17230]|uniref:Biotin/lipoyl attachment domain-containing protein n=1 Tax=Ignisphaera aggregans (strain DSM 17230 / JCM 13409 / AQ1.S1) TaxID=583356 RepID=E0SSQ2_IGNAA|nr:biotin/lipoyl attachment domain-containing protein [Ignisphaera aggregans DSM 17230]
MPQKIVVEFKNQRYEVEILEEKEGVIRVRVGDREYIVYLPQESTGYRSYQLLMEKGRAIESANRQAVEEELIQRKEDRYIYSEIPGRIVKYMVNEGDYIREGDVIAIIESMKMEIELRSNKSGRIKKILIPKGSFVNIGQPLIELG